MGEPFLNVSQGVLFNASGTILADLNFSIPKAKISVILGPSATGKTLLLQALAQALPMEIQRHGRWVFGTPTVGESNTDKFLLPQSRQRQAATPESANSGGNLNRHWTKLLKNQTNTVFLDEPVSGLDEAETSQFIQALKHRYPQQTVVMITHNLALAKAVADHIVMVCAGRIEASGAANGFFSNPPSKLVEKFFTTGNCWPSSRPLPLPTHFCWIITNKLAGMGKPGLLREVDVDLEAIGMAGVDHLVSLTEQPVAPERLQSFGIHGRHFRIKDMGVPSLNATASLIATMEKRIKSGHAVAYHCRAGLGRTGTVLACHLAWQGVAPEEAVKQIRKVQPGYIQNKTQLDFVYHFANSFCKPTA